MALLIIEIAASAGEAVDAADTVEVLEFSTIEDKPGPSEPTTVQPGIGDFGRIW